MKQYAAMLLLSALLLSEEEYPNFSNINKQKQFEREKLSVISSVNKKTMIIEAVIESDYIYLYNKLIDTSEQKKAKSYKKVSHQYTYTSEIAQNNTVITELELIKLAGLEKQYKETIDAYNDKLSQYNDKNIAYDIESEKYDLNKHVLTKQKKSNAHSRLFYPLLAVGSIPMILNKDSSTEIKIGFGIVSSIGVWGTYRDYKKAAKKKATMLTIINKLDLPNVQQSLNNESLKSIADSYNRSLYKKIQTR